MSWLRIEAERLCDENKGLKAENAKLREELAKARDPQRIGGQADPSSFVYAIEQLKEFRWQHATNDEDAIPYINNVAAAHERENAKLLELAHEQNRLTRAVHRYWSCGETFEQFEDLIRATAKVQRLFAELGIEVGE